MRANRRESKRVRINKLDEVSNLTSLNISHCHSKEVRWDFHFKQPHLIICPLDRARSRVGGVNLSLPAVILLLSRLLNRLSSVIWLRWLSELVKFESLFYFALKQLDKLEAHSIPKLESPEIRIYVHVLVNARPHKLDSLVELALRRIKCSQENVLVFNWNS